jgi:hypothetical protein
VQCRAYAHLGSVADLRRAAGQLADTLAMTRKFWYQDSHVEALVISLNALGQNAEANAVRNEYVNKWRRETGPLPDALGSVALAD